MSSSHNGGIAFTDVLAAALVLVVIFCMLPSPRGSGQQDADGAPQENSERMLWKLKQLHEATLQMALDGEATGDTNLGWPGDGEGTFSRWVENLVPAYLSTNDFLMLMSAPGETLVSMPAANNGWVRVYAVSSNSPPNAVLLAAANVSVAVDGKVSVRPRSESSDPQAFAIFLKNGEGRVGTNGLAGGTNAVPVGVPLLRD